MKQGIKKIFVVLLLGVLFGACSPQSYMRLEDPDLIYKRAMALYEEGKYGKANRYFENAIQEYIGTPREDSIAFFNAKCKFKAGDYGTAITYFDGYRRQFSRSPFLEDAEGMLTLSYYYTSPGPERDPTNIINTLASIKEFQSRYPNSEQSERFELMKEELIERLHDRAYLNAYTYYKTYNYKAAIVAFKNALKEYPNSKNREKIMYYMVVSAYELAHNSIPSLEVDRYMAMLDMSISFFSEFPESEHRKDVSRMVQLARAFLQKNNTTQTNTQGEKIIE